MNKVVLEKDTMQNEWIAKGVVFTSSGEGYTVRASHEVILSAGSVQSPQILELSGVGNPSVIEAAGIPLKVNSPNVGENLQEHMSKLPSSIEVFLRESLLY